MIYKSSRRPCVVWSLGTAENKLWGKFIKYGHLRHAHTQCITACSAIWFELSDCRMTVSHVTRKFTQNTRPWLLFTSERVWEQDYITSAPIYHTSKTQLGTCSQLHLPTTCTKLIKEQYENFVTRFFMRMTCGHKFSTSRAYYTCRKHLLLYISKLKRRYCILSKNFRRLQFWIIFCCPLF